MSLAVSSVGGHSFTVASRYDLSGSRILGRGSFGLVATATDSEQGGKPVAVKRIRPYANDEWDARHTLREIRLMRLLGSHPNVISLFDLSLCEEKSELYMVMELMDCDLHRIIQSKQTLTELHLKTFALQILEGIKAMHLAGVFHRDLKPGNLLVSKDCQLRITDFGLARFMDERTLSGANANNPMTEYVVTRWYRSPELLLAPSRPYSEAIDMWSVGCIVAELLRRKPLFPGKSHANQVQLIFEVPSQSLLRSAHHSAGEGLPERRRPGLPARFRGRLLPGAEVSLPRAETESRGAPGLGRGGRAARGSPGDEPLPASLRRDRPWLPVSGQRAAPRRLLPSAYQPSSTGVLRLRDGEAYPGQSQGHDRGGGGSVGWSCGLSAVTHG